MKSFLSIVNAICALLVIMCTAIEVPAFSASVYVKEFEKYNIPNKINVSKDDLTRVAIKLQNYMRDKDGNLDIDVTVGADYREFFNTKEKQHMVDVKYLFTIGFYVRNTAFTLFLTTCVLLFLIKASIKNIALTYFIVFCSFLLILTLLIGVIAIDFKTAFDIFHRIFFTNDLWQLDPSTDLLINIMPLEFFIDISKYIAGLFIGMCVVIISISIVIVKFRCRS